MSGHPAIELNRRAVFYQDDLTFRCCLFDVTLKCVLPSVQVDTLGVEILNVEVQIRNTPRDAVVVSNDHAGTPGSENPVTFSPGACRWTSYQVEGIPHSRCVSFAIKGLPEAVCLPEIAKAFDPG